MIRWTALALALIGGALGGLWACAPEPSRSEARREVVLWHSYRGAERDTLEALAADFERAHTDLKVRLLPVPYDALPDKLTAAVPRGNGPDLFVFAHDRVGDWADAELLEPLGLRVTPRDADHFARATLDALSHGGDLWGLPLAFKCLALYRNTHVAPEAPATTDALIAAAGAARRRDASVWGVAWELDSLYFHAPWLHGFGGAVYDGDADLPAFDSAAAVRSVDFVRSLVSDRALVPPEPTSALTTSLFRDGKLAFVVSGPWFRGELEGVSDWAVSPLPVVSETGRAAAPFLGVEAVLVSRRAREKDAAFELAQFLTNDVAATRRFTEAGQLVANVTVHATPEFQADAFARAFAQQVEHTVPLSNRPHMRRVWTPVKDALSAAIVRGEPPAAALERAARSVRP